MNPDLIYQHIGAIIRERRKPLKLTQDKLAKKLGISRASLANIETGRQRVLVHQLYSLAAELKLDPSDFLLPQGIVETKSTGAMLPLPEGLNSSQRDQIVRFFDAVPTEAARLKEENNVKQPKR